MRFEKIEINNYRQYQHLELDFALHGDRDISVIVGQNGAGKTNLLNAINWCFYGDEPHSTRALSDKSEEAEKQPMLNTTVMKAAEEQGDRTCPVSVDITANDGIAQFVFHREVKISTDKGTQVGKDYFKIIETNSASGRTLIYEGENALNVVAMLLPKKIREYFFFDGEQLLYYFNQSTSNINHLRDSIYELAQVNVLARTEDHLSERIRDLDSTIAKTSPQLENLKDARDTIESRIVARERDIEKLKEENRKAQSIIDECEAVLRGQEKVLVKQEQLRAKNDAYKGKEAELKAIIGNLAMLVRNYSVRLFINSAIKPADDYIQKQIENNKVSAMITKTIIDECLKNNRCVVCGEPISDSAKRHLDELAQSLYDPKFSQKLIEIHSRVKDAFDAGEYEQARDKLFQNKKSVEDEIEALEKEIHMLEDEVSAAASIAGLRAKNDQLNETRDRKEQNLKKIGSYEDQVANDRIELAKAEGEYSAAIEKHKECVYLEKKRDFAKRALLLLKETKNSIVENIRLKLEQKTIEYFNLLVWKKDEFGKVTVDEDFRIHLYTTTGTPCLDSLSAAETELLALSFTLAIHDVSGYDNLLYIDTPVGRVSDDNRVNFAQVLFDVSKYKQLILTFTPSEYSEEIQSVLNLKTVSNKIDLEFQAGTTRKV